MFHLSLKLKNVIKRWYFRDRAILDAMEENYNMAQECTEALRKGSRENQFCNGNHEIYFYIE